MTRWRSGLVACGLVLAGPMLTGCVVPATPSEHGWLVHGQRAAGDVVSALGTTTLVLQQHAADRLVPNYARVAVAQAESSAGGAVSAWGDEQPPQSQEQRAGRISSTLDDATTLISQARQALLDQDPHACARYCPQLTAMATKVQHIERALSRDADRVPVGQ